MNIAILVVRVVVGVGFAAHGAQKLFGWFGGYGLAGTGGFFESIGLKPGILSAGAAGFGEFGGGLLVALGLGGPIGPALMIAVMTVAAITVHLPHGFFVANNGFELPLVYASFAVLVALWGFGTYSLDAVLGTGWLSTERNDLVAIVAAVGVGVLIALARRPPPAPSSK
jgi:putative oxidoreductase